jgi:hypothetical protein
MLDSSQVEVADRVSRRRALLFVIAVAVFAVVQLFGRPFFLGEAVTPRRLTINLWSLNAFALMLALATGGGVLNRRALRKLVNDEVFRANRTFAAAIGYWVTLATAMAVFWLGGLRDTSGREAIYLIVSIGLVASCLAFALREHQAHSSK